MNRIDSAFVRLKKEGAKGFIPYVTAGYPDLDTTIEIICELGNRGVTAVEVGVPFSDPIADGPVIQASSQQALEAGTTLRKVLRSIEKARLRTDVPIVLFSYYNPVYKMGLPAFAKNAADAGVDGLLLLDLPFDEAKVELSHKSFSLMRNIVLISPTTDEKRLARMSRAAKGFIYAIARLGVTGTDVKSTFSPKAMVREIKKYAKVPVALGFGIATAEDVRQAAGLADAVIVGSAIVKKIGEHKDLSPTKIAHKVGEFVGELMEGLK